jgi:hypothetical protein
VSQRLRRVREHRKFGKRILCACGAHRFEATVGTCHLTVTHFVNVAIAWARQAGLVPGGSYSAWLRENGFFAVSGPNGVEPDAVLPTDVLKMSREELRAFAASRPDESRLGGDARWILLAIDLHLARSPDDPRKARCRTYERPTEQLWVRRDEKAAVGRLVNARVPTNVRLWAVRRSLVDQEFADALEAVRRLGGPEALADHLRAEYEAAEDERDAALEEFRRRASEART